MSKEHDRLYERTITYCATAIAGIQQFNDEQRQRLYNQFSTQYKEKFELFLLDEGIHEYNNMFVIINEESCGVFVDIDNEAFAESRDNEGNSILLIFKTKGSMTYETSVRSQLSILSLPHEIDASTLKAIINNGVYSIFDMLVQSNVLSCSAESFRITKSKLKDVSMYLQNLRHSIPVSDLSASTHARIQEIITKGANTSNYLEFLEESELSDSNFLNSLQSVANKWQGSLRTLADIQKDIKDGSASDEVQFWSNLQNSLISTTRQLQSAEVEITLSILTTTKRLRGISTYIADSGIMEKLQTVKGYNQFTSSIPLIQLYSSNDIPGIVRAIELIAAAFKKFRFSNYLASRFVVLVEKISKEVHDKLLEVSPNFFTVDYENFEANELMLVRVISEWNDILQDNNLQVREVVRRRAPEKVSTLKIRSSTQLEDTLKRISAFRKGHSLLSDALGMLDYEDFRSDLKFLYEPLSTLTNVSFYDWTKAQSIYNQRLQALESKLIQILQTALGRCKTSEEILNQFIKFMPLMAPYPRLRTIMKDHQQSLLNSVEQEIINLEKNLDSDGRVTDVLALKNLPPVSSVITECLQVRNRVNELQKRIKLLLGSDWVNSPNGSFLFNKCASLLEKLNVDDLVSNWIHSLSEDNSNVMDAPILKILVDNNKTFELLVNFNFSCGLVFKEVRNLIYMGYNLPTHILRIAIRYRSVYPQAILLLEQIQTFLSLVREVANRAHTGVLLRNNIENIWSLIGDAMTVSWSSCSFDDSNFVQDQKSVNIIVQLEKGISVAVGNFQKLHNAEGKLADELSSLSKTSYDSQKFSESIMNIQLIIEELRFLEFADLNSCIFALNKRIEEILVLKVQSILEDMIFTKQAISITFEGDVIRFSTSIHEIKMIWIQELENILLSATNQYRLKNAGFNMEHSNFITLYNILEECVAVTLRNLEQICESGSYYMIQWKEHEKLWDLEEAALQEAVGSSMDICYHLLDDFLQMRPSLSELKNGSFLHPLLSFQCEDVFSLVCMRFDYWQRYLCNLLVSLYMQNASFFCVEIKKDTDIVEQTTLDVSSLQSVLYLIKTIERINVTRTSRNDELKLLATSQRLLYRLRFKLPSQFVYIDQIENDYNNLTECTRKKEESLNKSRNLIITRLETEIQRVDNLSNSLVLNWTRKKPTSGEWSPIDALAVIASFEKSFETLNSDIRLISECARILLFPVVIKDHLGEASTELQNYKAVLMDLEGIWNSNDTLMELEWSNIDIMKLRSQAKIILEKMENLAPKVRQYKIFDHLISSTQELLDSVEYLKEMKDPSIKARHWNIIFKETCDTSISKILLEPFAFSLRDVLSVNFKLNEKFVKQVILKARREYVLEQSLHKIKIFWKDAQYETFQHTGGITLVKDWNFLQQSCTDDLEELVSMKNSAYYKIFEQDCLELESKLTALSGLQQDWMEVQFFWLDLYGIIGKNNELQNFLPLETSKFRSLSSDLKAILSKIFQLASAIDAVHISESFTAFKRILASFKIIKTSLNDFLERQRKLFPRFYFLGNDDLLKLLGACEDLAQVSSCLQKMYGTIAGLAIQGINVEGIYSVEGEMLKLENFIPVHPSLKCHEWLSLLDTEIRNTISNNITACISSLRADNKFSDHLDIYIFQVLLVSWQIFWTNRIDQSLRKKNFLNTLADINCELDSMLQELKNCKDPLKKRKIRSLLVECIHFCDIITSLSEAETPSEANLIWNNTQRFHYRDEESDALKRIDVFQSGRSSTYGFAYIGIPERLIYTQNLQRGFSALTEALYQKFGGCFFGPAGTGKTETVKALGQNLGRMVMVFNCDDSYDFQAMTRLLLGITQIGAWGCFDEFNRLDENILSAVSGHLEVIQNALYAGKEEVHIMRSSIPLNQHTAFFITLNPGYTGRSELPENLKKKFREFSMQKSDNHVISEVILRILGFDESKELARKIVELFEILESKCTPQKHYDFGLRILKKSLRNCQEIIKDSDRNAIGQSILVKSLSQILLPTLSNIDEEVFLSAIEKIFSNNTPLRLEDAFSSSLIRICKEDHMSSSPEFLKKCNQFYHIQKSQQAIILNGNPGVGKTSVWKTTLRVLKDMDNIDNVVYTIDTKTLSKEELYGKMNRATLEWRDGVFTAIIRQVHDDPTGAFKNCRIWIIFDSDLDPEYTETLNSALDDNKLITLPTGERISVPTNLHLIFEAPNLEYATPATITRCGLLWFPERVYSIYEYFKALLMNEFEKLEVQSEMSLRVIKKFQSSLFDLLSPSTFLKLIDSAKALDHVMGFDFCRSVSVLGRMTTYNLRKYEMSLKTASSETFEKFLYVKIYQMLIYAFVGDTSPDEQVAIREFFSDLLKSLGSFVDEFSPEDLELSTETLDVIELSSLVPKMAIEAHEVMKPNIIIPTLETIRHESLVFDLLNAGQAIILTGPPGSGKTMILNNALQNSPKFEVVGMNFSKDTTVAHILRTLKRHTIYTAGPKGLTLRPKMSTKEIVLFCDEINLPKLDKYGSQSVILFLRQLIERKGFWRANDNKWITIEGIHFVGACNPSTDPGRITMTTRFTRHVSILMIEYPRPPSLRDIYYIFFDATLRLTPEFRTYAGCFCEASIYVYDVCKGKFRTDTQAHYLCSPRELTRWIRGFYTAIINGPQQTLQSLLRIWAYEAWRIFADKLTSESEKEIFENILHQTALKYFPHEEMSLIRSSLLLFSPWLSLEYKEVSKTDLLDFIKQRFKTFCEEETEIYFIIYDQMLDHILRIDRILRQVQGHGMLLGPSRTGKTTMTKFVAWLNGLTVLQPNMHRNYTILEFDEFLRKLLIKCAIDEEKYCLIIDESHVLETSFLERMNTLLANSDIPDLFQGDQYDGLMAALKRKVLSLGLLIDGEQEMYIWFTQQISKNLHVIFTMCDSKNEINSAIMTSPALFNRCVINWMGEWSTAIMFQVANEIIQPMPLELVYDESSITKKNLSLPFECKTFQDIIVATFLQFHCRYLNTDSNISRSPGIFLDALKSFKRIFNEKSQEREDNQRFISTGLDKLNESVLKVKEMSKLLSIKQDQLRLKEKEARKTLDTMLVEQNEAERKQETTVDIKRILGEREKDATERRNLVMSDLKAFAPVMIEAQRGVKNIKKQQLTEIRSMINPPLAVKITMEAVCTILGHKTSSWRDIQVFIRKDEFIFEIVHFDTDNMLSMEMKSFIEASYLSRPDFTYEAVNRASKACGPLYQWVYAQVKYGEILKKVRPLQEEVKIVENEALQSKARLLAAEDMIAELEASIENLKQNYSSLIRDIELIKSEMQEVQHKMDRSQALVANLTTEKTRWSRSTALFKKSSKELTGNCLISALYSNYCGSLNEKHRKKILNELITTMRDFSIEFDPNYQFVIYTVEMKKRLNWVANGVPNEEFYLENLAMISSSIGIVPYILDPNLEIVPILSRYYCGKLAIMSFLEQGFVKRLKNAIKFGGVVLIQDSEMFDPMISNLISHEYKRSGERQTVQIGENEIDISPNFSLLLHSSNPNAIIPNYLKSRVRMINFTINKASIEMQAVRMALTEEAPEIQNEKVELMKLNGEYKIILKNLETRLLEGLNDSKGNILENDDLMMTLERLKLESLEIEKKLENTEDLMEKISNFSETYSLLGTHSAMLYSILEVFSELHWFYDIPMWQFKHCLMGIFKPGRNKSKEFGSRIEELLWVLYQDTYSLFSSYLAKRHKMELAIILYMMYHFGIKGEGLKENASFLLDLIRNNEANHHNCEKIKENYPAELGEVIRLLQDKSFIPAIQKFQAVFLRELTVEDLALLDGNVSFLMGSERNTDGSFKLIQIAKAKKQKLTIIALGSSESTDYAAQEISRSSSEGGWILLQNLQMSMSWTTSVLIKKIEQLVQKQSTNSRADVKIFMTCNLFAERLPLPLLQQCYKSVYEDYPSILNTVKDLWYGTCLSYKVGRAVSLFNASKFLLTWFHAILLGRSRLAPIGFSKNYDFNDCDFKSGLSYLDHLTTTTIHREKSPVLWEQICYSIGKIIYGGKVDDEKDFDLLQCLCAQIFSSRTLGSPKELKEPVELVSGVILPDQSAMNNEEALSDALEEIIEPIDSHCQWLGLPEKSIQEYEAIMANEIASQTWDVLQSYLAA